jgi:hypothetical protein
MNNIMTVPDEYHEQANGMLRNSSAANTRAAVGAVDSFRPLC